MVSNDTGSAFLVLSLFAPAVHTAHMAHRDRVIAPELREPYIKHKIKADLVVLLGLIEFRDSTHMIIISKGWEVIKKYVFQKLFKCKIVQ